jgi:hypothetical protein
MEPIWMVIAPSLKESRLLVTRGPGDTLLKAQLAGTPRYPRSLVALLEALALWEGRKVRAVVAVDDTLPSSVMRPFIDIAGGASSPLYSLDVVPVVPVVRRSRRRELRKMGNFRDLHRVLHHEVAR